MMSEGQLWKNKAHFMCSGGVILKKYVLLVVTFLLLCLLPGCQKKFSDNASPTGHASNEIDQPQIMYKDRIFYYWAAGFDERLPDSYICVGAIEKS